MLTYDTGVYNPVIAPETPTFVSEKFPLMPVISYASVPGTAEFETVMRPEALTPLPSKETLN